MFFAAHAATHVATYVVTHVFCGAAAQLGQMDAALARRELAKLGLPTSGKLDALKARLAAVPKPAP